MALDILMILVYIAILYNTIYRQSSKVNMDL